MRGVQWLRRRPSLCRVVPMRACASSTSSSPTSSSSSSSSLWRSVFSVEPPRGRLALSLSKCSQEHPNHVESACAALGGAVDVVSMDTSLGEQLVAHCDHLQHSLDPDVPQHSSTTILMCRSGARDALEPLGDSLSPQVVEKAVRESVEASLANLKRSHVHMYFFSAPQSLLLHRNREHLMRAAMRALQTCVDERMITAYGVDADVWMQEEEEGQGEWGGDAAQTVSAAERKANESLTVMRVSEVLRYATSGFAAVQYPLSLLHPSTLRQGVPQRVRSEGLLQVVRNPLEWIGRGGLVERLVDVRPVRERTLPEVAQSIRDLLTSGVALEQQCPVEGVQLHWMRRIAGSCDSLSHWQFSDVRDHVILPDIAHQLSQVDPLHASPDWEEWKLMYGRVVQRVLRAMSPLLEVNAELQSSLWRRCLRHDSASLVMDHEGNERPLHHAALAAVWKGVPEVDVVCVGARSPVHLSDVLRVSNGHEWALESHAQSSFSAWQRWWPSYAQHMSRVAKESEVDAETIAKVQKEADEMFKGLGVEAPEVLEEARKKHGPSALPPSPRP